MFKAKGKNEAGTAVPGVSALTVQILDRRGKWVAGGNHSFAETVWAVYAHIINPLLV